MARHAFAEHTGELELVIEAETLAGVFAEAAAALAEVMAGENSSAPPGARDGVTLVARDRAALLVDWLNELIFRSERDKKVYDDVRIEALSENRLVAAIAGRALEELRLPVKAATLHGLDIRATAGGFTARIVLDV
jgi:SHS2 domain-containing protein